MKKKLIAYLVAAVAVISVFCRRLYSQCRGRLYNLHRGVLR